MPDMTRRSFLKQGGATAAAAGALVATPRALRGSMTRKPTKFAPGTSIAAREQARTHNLVVHVPDTRRDEVRLLVGQREVVLHDRALVRRLSQAAD